VTATRRLVAVICAIGLLAGVGGGAYLVWEPGTRPETRLRLGQQALRAGDQATAEHYLWLLEAAGARDAAHLLRAELFFRQAKPLLDAGKRDVTLPALQRCQEELNRIRDRGPLRREAAALSGQCLLYLDEPAQAERAFTFVLQEDPDNLDAHRGLAALYFDQGASDRSVEHLQTWARLDVTDGRPLRQIGLIAKSLETYGRAIPAYEEALRRRLSERTAREVRGELAECLIRETAYERALDLLREAEGPAVPELKAECLYNVGRPADAERLLDAVLAEAARRGAPPSAGALRLRARLFQDAHRPGDAAALLERAVAVAPGDYATAFQLAQVYEELARRPEAEAQRRRADELKGLLTEMNRLNEEALGNAWDPGVRRKLADLCVKLGRPDQAQLWLRAAAACAPHQAGAKSP
jgi:tetratricopeptide (TPR) repeat protein